MPKKAKKALPQFLSDDEEPVKVQPVRAADNIDSSDDEVESTPPAPKQQPGHLRRVYTLNDDDNNDAGTIPDMKRSVTEPPLNDKFKRRDSANGLVDTLRILTQSGADLKGRMDDSGRFELEFELKQQQRRHREDGDRSYYRTSSSVASSDVSGSPSLGKLKGKPGPRCVGWSR